MRSKASRKAHEEMMGREADKRELQLQKAIQSAFETFKQRVNVHQMTILIQRGWPAKVAGEAMTVFDESMASALKGVVDAAELGQKIGQKMMSE